jgi:hypothetical protein
MLAVLLLWLKQSLDVDASLLQGPCAWNALRLRAHMGMMHHTVTP